MQNLPIYLYSNKLDVILDLDTAARGINQIMYQRDLTIQKGLKNLVKFQFKNSDQKRIHIASTQTLIFSMFDATNKQLMIEKRLEILDNNTTSTRGLTLLTLTESDTINLENGQYRYSIKNLQSDGSYTPAYTDTYYGISGNLTLLSDIEPHVKPSQEIAAFQKSFNATTMKYEHKSGNVYAYPEFQDNTALHTVALYLTAYKGTVYIQGTLDNSPNSFGNYDTLITKTYDGFTGVDPINFQGMFTYIRIMHVPATAPAESDNDNPAYYGSFDKFLYRS